MKFSQNEYGWDVEQTVPFLAFRALRRRAVEKVGEAAVLDLSQGEPGYGFSPSVRGRQFYAFLMFWDTVINQNPTDTRFGTATAESAGDVRARMKQAAQDFFAPQTAQQLVADIDTFLDTLKAVTKQQGHPKTDFDIVFDLHKFSISAGGRYPNSWGEMLVRMAFAEARTQELGFRISFEDLTMIAGASQGVSAFFKGFGEEGIGFLRPGDGVLMLSPVYAPYTHFVEDRQLRLHSVSVDPLTGAADDASLQQALESPERIKAIVLITPNNPTGFPVPPATLQKLGEIAEKHNAIVLSDEVYAEFFPGAGGALSVPALRRRTIRLNAISKIERSTGVRLGDAVILPEAKDFLTKEVIEPDCPGFTEQYGDVRWFFFLAKSSGGRTIGVFQHISGVPGPSQILGLCHLLLGREERQQYVHHLGEKVRAFYEELGIPHPGNSYYGLINLGDIESENSAQKPIEQVLTTLAEQGVILMPALRFFSSEDRKQRDLRRFIRVSLPNLSLEDTRRAARTIRQHLTGS